MAVIGNVPVSELAIAGVEVELAKICVFIALVDISEINGTASLLISACIGPSALTLRILPAR